ncbi:alpha/beta hydrolase [Chelativorans sp. AA-79]|uniref:alpha/beta hydrolase n=1 Tax=Chelativorans sp. AA-79 TaxID=3028735 RepID=UPI0023F8F7BF|nr:alpha/beta hydrolase [Chelativorans sp. AA-79]WEX11013.1 alpha/beta hydrolase [Chelativorans sp. AA-79]
MILQTLLEREGKNAIPYRFHGQPGKTITLNCYTSAGYKPGNDVVFVQHGMMRNGDDYRDFWIRAADQHDLLIVAPTFSRADFPEAENYNNGIVLDTEGNVTARDSWIYHVPARVVADLVAAGVMEEGRARIYGHSAGGQFLHRMVSLVGVGPFKSVIAANAGWYSLPTLDTDFPAGLAGIGLGEADLRELLGAELWIMAGQMDCEANADNLPSQPEALEQGTGRLHRARNYMANGKAAAEALGCAFGWRLTEVPGVAHDGCAMSQAAAGVWFEGGLPSAEVLGAGAGAVNA